MKTKDSDNRDQRFHFSDEIKIKNKKKTPQNRIKWCEAKQHQERKRNSTHQSFRTNKSWFKRTANLFIHTEPIKTE